MVYMVRHLPHNYSYAATCIGFLLLQIVIFLGLAAMVAADSDEFRGYGAPRVSGSCMMYIV